MICQETTKSLTNKHSVARLRRSAKYHTYIAAAQVFVPRRIFLLYYSERSD